MYFNRTEFDRYVIANSWGSSTEFFHWEDLCAVELKLPSLAVQEKYVAVYSHLPDVRLHDLRHSTASNLLQNGASLPAVSSWVGHSSPETTLRFYAHANMDDKKAISGLVEKMINIV